MVMTHSEKVQWLIESALRDFDAGLVNPGCIREVYQAQITQELGHCNAAEIQQMYCLFRGIDKM